MPAGIGGRRSDCNGLVEIRPQRGHGTQNGRARTLELPLQRAARRTVEQQRKAELIDLRGVVAVEIAVAVVGELDPVEQRELSRITQGDGRRVLRAAQNRERQPRHAHRNVDAPTECRRARTQAWQGALVQGGQVDHGLGGGRNGNAVIGPIQRVVGRERGGIVPEKPRRARECAGSNRVVGRAHEMRHAIGVKAILRIAGARLHFTNDVGIHRGTAWEKGLRGID